MHDAALRTQAVFRVLLTAMSRPGEVARLPPAETAAAARLVEAVCRTLLDHEVGFALAGTPPAGWDAATVARWTGSRPLPVEEADFLLVAGPATDGGLLRLRRGTPEHPDTGATAIFFLPRPLPDGYDRSAWTISGPGVPPPGRRPLPQLGLADEEISALREACAAFPLGVDCLFIDPAGAVVGLPRSATLGRVA